ncbi:MAG: hypothetical protein HYY40_00500 [Bacteroidetes bacterium]|nr:hypothetical protein [Bacteroidota bacterium]
MRSILNFIILIFPALPVYPQFLFHNDSLTPEKEGEVQVLYRNEMAFGGFAHSNGFGIAYRRGRHLTGYKKIVYEVELANIRHPKEYKVFNPNLESSKGFIYGKLNNFYIFRPGIGFHQTVVSKIGEGTIEIRYLASAGVSIGLLKPIYLEVSSSASPTGFVIERYDPQVHHIDRIYGKAPFSKGLDELRALPGGYLKFGLSFEYAGTQQGIKILETGVAVDFFNRKIPIMAKLDGNNGYDPNNNVVISFYVAFFLGEKWY